MQKRQEKNELPAAEQAESGSATVPDSGAEPAKEIGGRDWYGDEIWSVFERGHAELAQHYAEMADKDAMKGRPASDSSEKMAGGPLSA